MTLVVSRRGLLQSVFAGLMFVPDIERLAEALVVPDIQTVEPGRKGKLVVPIISLGKVFSVQSGDMVSLRFFSLFSGLLDARVRVAVKAERSRRFVSSEYVSKRKVRGAMGTVLFEHECGERGVMNIDVQFFSSQVGVVAIAIKRQQTENVTFLPMVMR